MYFAATLFLIWLLILAVRLGRALWWRLPDTDRVFGRVLGRFIPMGSRLTPRCILALGSGLAMILVYELIVQTAPWRDMGGVAIRFVPERPGVRVLWQTHWQRNAKTRYDAMTPEERIADIRRLLGQNDRMATENETLDALRTYRPEYTPKPVDRVANLLGGTGRALPQDFRMAEVVRDTTFLTVFWVKESLESLTTPVSRGWFRRLTAPGGDPVLYEVATWCGFDLSVTPAKRVCFTALPMPVFYQIKSMACARGDVVSWGRMLAAAPRCQAAPARADCKAPAAGSVVQTLAIRNAVVCEPLIKLPWVHLRLQADGAVPFAWEPVGIDQREYQLQPAHAGLVTDLLTLTPEARGSIVPWRRFVGDDGSIPLTLTPITDIADLRAEPLWSRRQIERNASRVKVGPDAPRFTGVTVAVRVPAAFVAAARFLGRPPHWPSVATEAEVLQDIRRVHRGAMLERVESAPSEWCRRLMTAYPASRAANAPAAAKAGPALFRPGFKYPKPWRFRINDEFCPGVLLSLILQDLVFPNQSAR